MEKNLAQKLSAGAPALFTSNIAVTFEVNRAGVPAESFWAKQFSV